MKYYGRISNLFLNIHKKYMILLYFDYLKELYLLMIYLIYGKYCF